MFLQKIKKEAQRARKRIVFPESGDERVLRAAGIVARQKLAKVILLGNQKKIEGDARRLHISLSNIDIVNPADSEKSEGYAQRLFELRKKKGMTINDARNLVKKEIYFGMMMLKEGDADGLISGVASTTAETVRPAFQIIGTEPGVSRVSGCFIILWRGRIFLLADCAVNPDPNAEELADIALISADTYKKLIGKIPRVAMLSFSTKGSAEHELVTKVREATRIAKQKKPGLAIDGEMQLDAAIVPEVAKLKCPKCAIKGDANVLIFPDLNTGNIGYKLVERFGRAIAIGPILQGLAMPVNDMSRGCSVKDIVNMAAITSVMK